MKSFVLCVLVVVLGLSGCQRDHQPQAGASQTPAAAAEGGKAEPATPATTANLEPTGEPVAAKRGGSLDPSQGGGGNSIQALIRALTNLEDRSQGSSATMSGREFAPITWARRVKSGSLPSDKLENAAAVTRLVELGPRALPHLLSSLDDSTPTRLLIDHSGGFGGIWYGQRPAIRWVSWEADFIRRLADRGLSDSEIAGHIGASLDFVAWARSNKTPFLLPQRGLEFNPRANAAEQRLLDRVRQEFVERHDRGEVISDDQGSPPRVANRKGGALDFGTRQYTLTVGDVCYVIIGQITNRTYCAVQYQPTSCLYIHSPTRESEIAADVRSIWTSDNSEEMLYASLQADFGQSGEATAAKPGAALRLGYYFPQRSEQQLLELLARLVTDSVGDADYQRAELLDAVLASRSERVQRQLLELLKTTDNVQYFLSLQRAFGSEHDLLVRERMVKRIEEVKEADDVWTLTALLDALIDRFPSDARPLCSRFVESTSLRRKDIVINALWNHAWAVDLLPPLLDEKSPFGHYSEGDRVCDRAAQAISNNLQVQPFDSDASQAGRDEQIRAIKARCREAGMRKTDSD